MESVRVAFYGTGKWAKRSHLPNLRRLDGVDIVAACDVDEAALESTLKEFEIERTYANAYKMLESEELDVLYSCIPALARTVVEAIAAEKGVHLFSEKLQALSMDTALAIDRAITRGGVMSTVCFRERSRPLFQEAKRLLEGQNVVHVAFQSVRPPPEAVPLADRTTDWHQDMSKAGGPSFDWGVHAVDYTRFLTGLEIATGVLLRAAGGILPAAFVRFQLPTLERRHDDVRLRGSGRWGQPALIYILLRV